MNRKPAYLLLVIALLLFSCKMGSQSFNEADPWAKMAQIVEYVVVPTFPENRINVVDLGADPKGELDNTKIFAEAISRCSKKGGGMVFIPKGIYKSGPIHLEDNINFHLEEGAEIRFNTDPKAYLPLVHTSFEGIELMNYSPLIYAYKKKNIAITGKGILNGQAGDKNWWTWKGSETYGWQKEMPSQLDSLNLPRLMKMAENNIPVNERIFGESHYLRPSFVEPFECTNVLIQGVKIINAPFWIMHPIKCNNVIIDGVTVESHGPNNDGCDPEYSKNVIIKNCTFNTGDDCIAIKSGRDADGRRVGIKSENIVIQNCTMIDGHGGVVMGSETSAGVSYVFVENCVMNSPNLDRAIRIKSNSKRGGITENVFIRNISVGEVKEAFLKINMFYATYANQKGEFIPTVRNIIIENATVKNAGQYGILIMGHKDLPVKNITLKNVVIEKAETPYSMDGVSNIKLIDTYINGSMVSYTN